MSVQVETLEKNMAKLTIELSEDVLEQALQEAYLRQRNKISLPGFRKGKAPRHMLEKVYGPEIFFEDAANQLIRENYGAAADESGLDIVSHPTVDIVQIEKGRPFIFTAEVAVRPEVALGEYKGIAVTKADVSVTDEEMDAAIERERQNNARIITVEDRAIAEGDTAVIDYEGFVDGTPFEGGKAEGHALEIGSHSFIDTFEEQLIGKRSGEEAEIHVTFPEEYHAAELAGKPAVFQVKIHEIRTKELPELDDEFASEVSEFETLAEYKEDVRATLTSKKEKEAKDAKEAAVIEAIVKDSEMEIPEAMLLTQQKQMVDEFAQRMQMQGISMDQYLQFTGATYDKMMEQVRPQAERRIKSRLVLEAVVKAENIEASDADYEEELKSMAEAYQMEVDKEKEMLPEKSAVQIKQDIAVRKAAEFVVEKAKEK